MSLSHTTFINHNQRRVWKMCALTLVSISNKHERNRRWVKIMLLSWCLISICFWRKKKGASVWNLQPVRWNRLNIKPSLLWTKLKLFWSLHTYWENSLYNFPMDNLQHKEIQFQHLRRDLTRQTMIVRDYSGTAPKRFFWTHKYWYKRAPNIYGPQKI